MDTQPYMNQQVEDLLYDGREPGHQKIFLRKHVIGRLWIQKIDRSKAENRTGNQTDNPAKKGVDQEKHNDISETVPPAIADQVK